MAKVSCFYNCGASSLTLANIDQHYQKYHQKLKAYYWREGFTCDNCHHWQGNSMLYSPARSQSELNQKPHYCGKCANYLQSQPIQLPLKPKKIMKNKKSSKKLKPKKTKKAVKTTALTLKKSVKSIKNPLEYYQCMKNCCLKKQKISQTAHECRTNALTINRQMSASKKKAVQKIRSSYLQMGIGLAEFVKANK